MAGNVAARPPRQRSRATLWHNRRGRNRRGCWRNAKALAQNGQRLRGVIAVIGRYKHWFYHSVCGFWALLPNHTNARYKGFVAMVRQNKAELGYF
jgi:hypothetical protein